MIHRVALTVRWLLLAATLWAVTIASGCSNGPATNGGNNPTPAAPPPVQLTLLVVDDPALAAAVEREWKARGAGELFVTQATVAQLRAPKQLDVDAILVGVDALLVPPALLGELAESGRIEPPPASMLREKELAADDPTSAAYKEFAPGDLLSLGWDQECRWGQETWAIPFGSPQLTLLYRADIFAKLNLAPPKTWAEYDALSKKLTDRGALGELAPAADKPWAGSVEPMAGDWAAEMLQARVASSLRDPVSYSGLFDIVSMKSLVAEPPFVAALREMQAAGWLDAERAKITPAEARKKIRSGETAMAITWPTANRDENVPLTLPAGATIGIAELPGAVRYYSHDKHAWVDRPMGLTQATPLLAVAGRIGVVSAESRKRLYAWRMLMQLAGKEWSPTISPASPHTAPFRRSHLEKPNFWVDATGEPTAGAAYADLLLARDASAAFLVTLRLPGRERYLAALAKAIDECRGSPEKIEPALQAAATEWDKITDSLGRDAQRKAYRKSLGLEK